MMMRWKNGFTLTELLIVVAVIGVLAAIALPSYQDYMTRARISEADALSSIARISLGEACTTNTLISATNASLGLATPSSFATTKVVQSITAEGRGATEATITVVLKKFGGVEAGNTLIYKGTCGAGGMSWAVDGSSTVPGKFQPRL